MTHGQIDEAERRPEDGWRGISVQPWEDDPMKISEVKGLGAAQADNPNLGAIVGFRNF